MRTTLGIWGAVVWCGAASVLAWAPRSVADFDLNTAVAVWHMDEGEGDQAKDSSPSGNHGELWLSPAWVDGRFGKGLRFDGTSFVWVRTAANLPLGTSPRTIMCHFKWAEVNDFVDAVLAVNDAETLVCLGPNHWRQPVRLQISADGGPGGFPGVDTFEDRRMFEWDADTEWHHFAVVLPEGATRTNEFLMYFDGVLQETFVDDDINQIDSGGGEATIGCWTGRLSNKFNGTIDEVAVFPFAMAAEDIANVAEHGLVAGQALDVSPRGKVATSWGALRQRYCRRAVRSSVRTGGGERAPSVSDAETHKAPDRRPRLGQGHRSREQHGG